MCFDQRQKIIEPPMSPGAMSKCIWALITECLDVHAALGLSQMQRLDKFVDRRRQIAQQYDKHLADLPFTLPFQDECGQSALHLYPVLVSETGDVGSVR